MSTIFKSPGEKAHCELYERTLSKLPYYNNLENKSLLEVGCGLGGGLKWIQKIHSEIGSVLGIDKCAPSTMNPLIVQGDAEDLPVKSNTFDIVLNIESSHLYGNPESFFSEAFRALKPGGHLCWADLRRIHKKDEPIQHAQKAGFKLVELQIINQQILNGIQLTSTEYDKILDKAPIFIQPFKNAIRATYCAPGTEFYRKLKEYETIYWICLWKKPESDE
ncbi:unnamed protein product [Bursaphelenchus okinawaensis]|uniref:Methyltransferase type 11 domain-containing protein n=1 Tax=Bursaphelenchus okinawaensis TaxID=465554 RepID=A0A811KTX0_9BILA|nr:unnamed protein product [Bursaphelenchus okinawaensis]CAG9112086.1 unnamed protein product [Bursaphelenchus okinawaensis]